MKKSKTKKLLAFVLALMMLIGSVLPASAADVAAEQAEGTDSEFSFAELSDDFSLINYESYKTKYEYTDKDGNVNRTGESASVAGVDYIDDIALTDAEISVETINGRECLVIGEGNQHADSEDETLRNKSGVVSWEIDVPSSGFYCVSFDFCAVKPVDKDETDDEEPKDPRTDIERVFMINGKAPFQEARYQKFAKTWYFVYQNEDGKRDGAFKLDSTGNELKPDSKVEYIWDTHTVEDSDGHYGEPFEFYLEAGKNVISLETVRDKIAISEIRIHSYEVLPTYEEVKEQYKDAGYKPASGKTVKIEAETPDYVSNYTIYPIYDRSSPITSPQDSSKIMRNTMGGDKWVTPGQWIRYEFEVEESGLYQIGVRFRQDQLKGMYTTRSVKIDGEFPFAEALDCQFPYGNGFQFDYLNNGEDSFEFYLEKGTHTVEFEVVLGSFAAVVRQINDVISSLNKDYMRILELTGADADEYRDYGLMRIMPDVIRDLGLQAEVLYSIVDYISDVGGIKSDTTSTLEQAASLIEKMASDEKEIAANLAGLKERISSLGTWLSESSAQFLEVDYITIAPAGAKVEEAEAGFWASLWFEILKFFASFVSDYDSLGTEGDADGKLITVWTSSGRDQAQIIKTLIEDGYTEETGVKVNLKLTAGGALLPSILAGVGPDVSIDATNPIEMAIRGAILPLNDCEGFDELVYGKEGEEPTFADSAIKPLSLYGKTYAIPVTQGFPVMFVRDDILAELDLEKPDTWDELMSLVPVLQFNNMEIGMTQDFNVFLYQAGGNYWKNEGMATNLDDYQTLDAFEYMCNLFTQYSLPTAYDAQNRFKTGEMPILISDYGLYNNLTVFAPEISGLWNFYQIPGTEIVDEETGKTTIDRTSMSTIAGVILPRGCSDKDTSWTFIKWFAGTDFQVDYSNEMMALLGPSAKQAVANIPALKELPWSAKEAAVLDACIKETDAIEPYPGSYYIGRYTSFAFAAAYNEGADPSDSLLEYIDSINKELSRKRKEFELMLNEDWLAIQEYMKNTEGADPTPDDGIFSFDDWKVYWDKEIAPIAGSTDYIQNNDNSEFTYVDWMEDHGVTADNYVEWKYEVKDNKTDLSYNEWLKK